MFVRGPQFVAGRNVHPDPGQISVTPDRIMGTPATKNSSHTLLPEPCYRDDEFFFNECGIQLPTELL